MKKIMSIILLTILLLISILFLFIHFSNNQVVNIKNSISSQKPLTPEASLKTTPTSKPDETKLMNSNTPSVTTSSSISNSKSNKLGFGVIAKSDNIVSNKDKEKVLNELEHQIDKMFNNISKEQNEDIKE